MTNLHRLAVFMSLLATLCPTVHSFKKGWDRGRAGSVGGAPQAAPPSWGHGSSRQGMKMAGAAAAGALGGAAAGALGGAALGYGVGSMERWRPGYGYNYGYGGQPIVEDPRYMDGRVVHNQWYYYNSANSIISKQGLLGAVLVFLFCSLCW